MAKKYPVKVKEHAISLVKKGASKLEASIRLGIPYRTVIDWTLHIKTRKIHPRHIKKQAIRLTRAGLLKKDVSRVTGVPYGTVLFWTKNMKGGKRRPYISGRILNFLRLLVERGYILSSEVKQMTYCTRTLEKYIPLKRTKIRKAGVWYLAGKEREAMEGLLKNMNKRSISYHELGKMRRVFGIKNMKQNNKIRGRFFK